MIDVGKVTCSGLSLKADGDKREVETTMVVDGVVTTIGSSGQESKKINKGVIVLAVDKIGTLQVAVVQSAHKGKDIGCYCYTSSESNKCSYVRQVVPSNDVDATTTVDAMSKIPISEIRFATIKGSKKDPPSSIELDTDLQNLFEEESHKNMLLDNNNITSSSNPKMMQLLLSAMNEIENTEN